MPRLELGFLGPFQVTLDGQLVAAFESNKVRALLAYLATEAGRSQPRERLAGLLWPDWPQQSAMSNLRYALADLRKNIGDREASPPFLLITRESVQLNRAADIWVDVGAFESAIRDLGSAIGDLQSSIHNLQSTIENLQSAISLYRGPFLEGFSLTDSPPFEEWLLAKREYFSQHMLNLLQILADHFEQSGELEQAKGNAQRQLNLEPWREEAHQQLMRLLALSGQRSAALAQYEKCKRSLRDGLGVEPGAETAALYERIREGTLTPARLGGAAVGEGTPAAPVPPQAPPSPVPRPRHNLPRQLTRFIGREKQVAQVTDLVRQNPLVTLTGSGGVGKTRLALVAAEALLDDFKDGVWLVDLASLTDPQLVPRILASTLGVRENPGQSILETLSLYFRDRETLLVLDNCEHLLEACAGLAIILLSAAPRLKILATSREALGVPGEAIVRVPSLLYPSPGQALEVEALLQVESVCLFLDRAKAVLAEFHLVPANAAPVTQICQRLDGIPLALELAAARVASLDVTQIAARLDQTFRLLAGGSRAALERHRTLRATVDWSFNLLSDAERLLLPRLSVFAGGWTLVAAEAVCSDTSTGPSPAASAAKGVCAGDGIAAEEVMDLLAQLVNKSMLVVDRSIEGGLRYRMLEMIRQYAAEKLFETGDSERLRQRHLAYYLAFAEGLENGLRGSELVSRLERLEAELDNFRRSLEWGLQTDVLSELRLASALMWFWHIHSNHRNEGTAWLEQGLQAEGAARARQEAKGDARAHSEWDMVRAKALSAVGFTFLMQDNYKKAVYSLEESLALYRRLEGDHRWGIAFALGNLGTCYYFLRDYARARSLTEQSRRIFEEIGDKNRLGDSFFMLGSFETDPERARQFFLEQMAHQKESGDIDGIATATQNLGWAAAISGDYHQAIAWYQESLADYRQVGNYEGVANQIMFQAQIFWNLGDYQQATQYFRQAAAIYRDVGGYEGYASCTFSQARVALSAGLYPEARQHTETALVFGRELSDKAIIAEAELTQARMDWLNGEDVQATRRVEEARTIFRELNDPWGSVHLLGHLAGRLALGSGDLPGARGHFKESLQNSSGFGLWKRGNIAIYLDDLASLAVKSGDIERAARLFSVVEGLFPGLANTLSPIERAWREQDIQTARLALGDEEYQRQSDLGRALPLELAVAYALEDR